MNVYYQNNKARLTKIPTVQGSDIDDIYDPMLELAAQFKDETIIIEGFYNDIVAIDSLCLGFTNAASYELTINDKKYSGLIRNEITIHDFDEPEIIESFSLTLYGLDPIYLGHLYLGNKVILPRFLVRPNLNLNLRGERVLSDGGQSFGIKRKALESFAVSFSRISNDEKNIIKNYINSVQNIDPHIIDPYPEARDKFPPKYAVVNTDNIPFPKRNEPDFYYDGSLSWQEVR